MVSMIVYRMPLSSNDDNLHYDCANEYNIHITSKNANVNDLTLRQWWPYW